MFRRLIPALLLCLVQISLLVGQEEENWSPGEYMQQATSATFEKASLMNALSEFSISKNLSMAGAIIGVGSTIAIDLELEVGKQYTFIGGGDEDVVDLDMYVVDRNGEVVCSDVEDDDTPIPDFTAAYSGRYSLRLQLVSGQAPTSFVSFIMMTTTGNTIEEDAFTAISSNFYSSGATLHNVSEGIRWHDLDNQWCLFGLLLDSGADWELENLRLGSESHYIYGICGENTENIDLDLNSSKGVSVAVDTDDDAYPILEINTNDQERYTLKISNKKSDGPALIMVGIVTE